MLVQPRWPLVGDKLIFESMLLRHAGNELLELRREEHEKQFRDWAAEKAKGSKDPLAQLSSQEREVVEKLRMLMGNKFKNDHEQLFKHYDADHTGSLQHEEVRQVIKDAGVSASLVRQTSTYAFSG